MQPCTHCFRITARSSLSLSTDGLTADIWQGRDDSGSSDGLLISFISFTCKFSRTDRILLTPYLETYFAQLANEQ